MTKLTAGTSPAGAARFHEIDLLRAVACLMVVFFHYAHRGALDGWSPAANPIGLSDFARYGYLGVHLFFIISGFVIFLSVRNATVRDFFASRVSRLYPAYWVAVPLTWVLVKFFDLPELQVSWWEMLVNLTMVPHWFGVPYVDGAYWSLGVELQFYILVGVALKFDLDRRAEWFLAGWLLLHQASSFYQVRARTPSKSMGSGCFAVAVCHYFRRHCLWPDQNEAACGVLLGRAFDLSGVSAT